MIEHDDEELSSSADVSPLSSCAALHAFQGGAAELRSGSRGNSLAGAHEGVGCLGSPMAAAAAASAPAALMQGRLAAAEGDLRRGVISSMATTRGSQALLEAAVSSTLVHPNIVQVLPAAWHALHAAQARAAGMPSFTRAQGDGTGGITILFGGAGADV